MDKLEDILSMADRAEAYYRLVEYFVSCSDAERHRIRNTWDFGREWVYPGMNTLVHVDPNQRSCYERIRASLTYYAIVNFELDKEDFRQDFMGIAIYYHALREIGHDPAILFEETAQMACPDIARLLRRFITEKEENKSLDYFGIKKIIDKDGQVVFQHCYFEETLDREETLKWGEKERASRLKDILRITDRAKAYFLLVDQFIGSSNAERDHIRSSWNFGKKWICPNPYILARADPDRQSYYERIRACLMYYVIADSEIDRKDFRLGFIDLCLICHALNEIGWHPTRLFNETAKMSSPDIAEVLRGFVAEKLDWKKFIGKDGQVLFQNEYLEKPFTIEEVLRQANEEEGPAK